MKFKKKFLSLFIIFIVFFSNVAFANEPNIASSAAILVESSTGKILYEKNAYEKMYPASTTKIMTAILALENCDLDEKAKVSYNAVYSLPSGYVNANLINGEEIAIKDLMYALLVKSANDAAIVLAEHIGGSVENFSEMMNKKAKELGCQNTNFINPNGIHNNNHYSTAYDLYLIASYCMKNETFRKYVSTTNYTLPATNKYEATDRVCITTNDMLRPKSKYYNKNVIGIKTGYTTESQNCLIAAAEKNGIQLISVVLHGETNPDGSSQRYIDTTNLFNYGFDDFKFTDIITKGKVIKNIEIPNASKDTKQLDLIAEDTLNGYLKNNIDTNNLSYEIDLNESIEAPIQENSVLGNITYTIDNISYKTNLLASHSVKKKFNIKILLLMFGLFLLIKGILLLLKFRNKKLKKRRK